MAIIKSISSRSIKNTINYITQEAKTSTNLITGFNCNADNALMQMQVVKKVYGKTDGRSCFHYVQSFSPNEDVTPELVHQIGCELVSKCKKFRGFQAVIATHVDKEHIHNHIVFNSVNVHDGKKMQSSRADLKALKDLSDECCIKHGLTITEKGKAFDGSERCEVSTSKSKSYRVFLAAENGKTESWVVNIAASVLENKHLATSKEDFCERMNAAGINVRWTEGRKNITFSMGSKRVRSNKLQEYFKLDFSKEVLEREFECNRKTTIPAKEQDNHADEREQCFEREDKDSRSSSSARAAELGGKIEQVRARISKSFGRDEEAYSISIPKEEKTTTVPLRKKTKLFMQPSRYDELERSKERDFER